MDTKQLVQKATNSCLTMTEDFKLLANQCDDKQEGQKWTLENLIPERVKEF